ncbi:electron transport complex subunit RsxB [Variovorax sp. PAMC28562]|uniref:electron transport complex subunit RsxB n=1 Tax=Variovorax sp. PAMC28562 TaxID=2762323 RepID=UPI00164CFAA5|nr:electron transport complex subunit RsxB [Variovorax sp. PAMC28562]QNK73439.1 electron transport complex subunit RsxB [Variovorax sp. PAMC28562]
MTEAPSGTLAARINDALPQTQCTRCGYPDCNGYAEAIAADDAAINQCPPGGAEGIGRLSSLTGRPAIALDPQFGIEAPRLMAVIDETWCIGCTLCLDACPTDAILGIHKRMHTVIEAHCTGCELCIPVCPVDCISLEVETPGLSGWDAWSSAQADHSRQRYESHKVRRPAREEAAAKLAQDASANAPNAKVDADADADARKRSVVEAAMARARAAAAARKP